MGGAIVSVDGPSAAGKSRAVRRAAAVLGAVPLPEAYDRLRPRPPLSWARPAELLGIERTLLREEGRRYREARALAADGALVLADTGFWGPLTYLRGLVALGQAPPELTRTLLGEARALAARGRWGLPDAVVLLRTPAAERDRRAAGDPEGHPVALRARHRAVGEVESGFYRRTVAPAFGPRYRSVRGTGSPSAIAARVARAAAQLRAEVGRSPPPPLGPLLRALGVRAGRSVPSPAGP